VAEQIKNKSIANSNVTWVYNKINRKTCIHLQKINIEMVSMQLSHHQLCLTGYL